MSVDRASRYRALITSATAIFRKKGYRRASVAEIARDMGVAPGTVYLYVESKAALFDMVLRYHLLDEREPPPLPYALTDPTDTPRRLQSRAREIADRALAIASDPGTNRPFTGELARVFFTLYDVIWQHRQGIAVIERAALDRPELAALFYGQLRARILEGLTAYLEANQRRGHLRPGLVPGLAARHALEALAWFAMHRLDDPLPPPFPEETIRRGVVDMLVASMVVEPAEGAGG